VRQPLGALYADEIDVAATPDARLRLVEEVFIGMP
jgi:hypothetical protein